MMRLRDRIVEEIRKSGPIRFSRYMTLCLYDAELGYYARAREQFGKAGDFYTSSDVHAVFGRLLARQFQEMWQALGRPFHLQLIEMGPGRGLFAHDVLAYSARHFADFFQALHYVLVEASPGLQKRLREGFSAAISTGKVSVLSGLDAGDNPLEDVIIFANEFFDALPIEILSKEGEIRVDEQGGKFIERFAQASPEELEFLDRYGVHPEDDGRAEANLEAMAHMRRTASLLRRGFMIVIDYGYTRAELLAGRAASTVRAFRQHSLSASPYEAPGEQDITAHVNFTALAAAGSDAGLTIGPLLTQAQFLMGIGEVNEFAEAFEDAQLPQEKAKIALQLKHLVTPAGMGEYFRVLLMWRGVDEQRVRELSGMRFA
ncbi:MAG: SAM-dependent methyltransferase [Terriglobales bacterium]|jgi:SAM-dependent MidA family methyltransferase